MRGTVDKAVPRIQSPAPHHQQMTGPFKDESGTQTDKPEFITDFVLLLLPLLPVKSYAGFYRLQIWESSREIQPV